jgi:four helix bundle protein
MVQVYSVTRSYPRDEQYGMTSQMRRASCSVVSHIAEGQGRVTFGERRQMLSQARGSLFEVQAQILASRKLGYIDATVESALQRDLKATARELGGLLAWIRKCESESKRRKSEKT